jgi:hypothetical protein
MRVHASLLLLHDVVDPLHQVLDDPVGADLDLQPSWDRVGLDARDGVPGDGLDLLLLFGRPLGGISRRAHIMDGCSDTAVVTVVKAWAR